MEEKITSENKVLSPELCLPEIKELLHLVETKQYSKFRSVISDIPSADVADFFDKMPKEYYVPFYRLLPKKNAAEIFVEMDAEQKRLLIESFTDSELSSTLEELYIDDTVDMIEEMPAAVVKRILRQSSGEDRAIINTILHYPKDSA